MPDSPIPLTLRDFHLNHLTGGIVELVIDGDLFEPQTLVFAAEAFEALAILADAVGVISRHTGWGRNILDPNDTSPLTCATCGEPPDEKHQTHVVSTRRDGEVDLSTLSEAELAAIGCEWAGKLRREPGDLTLTVEYEEGDVVIGPPK